MLVKEPLFKKLKLYLDKKAKLILLFILKYFAVDAMWNEWSQWSACSETCGPTGVSERNRTCLHEGSFGGDLCSYDEDQESVSCNTIVACDDGGSKFKLSKTAYLQNRG